MSICKEQFISALRDGVSAEFDFIPKNEDTIEYSFSKNFEKRMQKLIQSQQKPFWNFINTVPRRVAVVCIAALCLICGMLCVKPIRVAAVEAIEEIIVKTKNVFQVAYENGTPLSEVDKEGNFKYTEFTDEERETRQDETSLLVTGEQFKDPKTNLYNKMLNTIDHFNTVELSAEIHMTAEENVTVDYYTDIDSSLAYQAVYEFGALRFETFCNPKNEFLIDVDHKRQIYNLHDLPVYGRSDSPYIPLEERIVFNDATGDGLPGYRYRTDITNCPRSSYTIFPQGLTYSYLADFELWQIAEDNVPYLNRNCIKITGTPKPYTGEKHQNDHFMMLVDVKTGILLKFEGYKNGNVSRYITVTKCIIDEKPNIKEFDIARYSSYKEVFR